MVELKSGHTFAAIDPYIAVVQNLKKTGHDTRRVYYLSAGINNGYEIVHSWDGAEYTQRPRHHQHIKSQPKQEALQVQMDRAMRYVSKNIVFCTNQLYNKSKYG